MPGWAPYCCCFSRVNCEARGPRAIVARDHLFPHGAGVHRTCRFYLRQVRQHDKEIEKQKDMERCAPSAEGGHVFLPSTRTRAAEFRSAQGRSRLAAAQGCQNNIAEKSSMVAISAIYEGAEGIGSIAYTSGRSGRTGEALTVRQCDPTFTSRRAWSGLVTTLGIRRGDAASGLDRKRKKRFMRRLWLMMPAQRRVRR